MTRVTEIITEAKEIYATALSGLDMLKSGPANAKLGFRNVAIFGRMVTFALNNLSGKVDGFAEWDREAKKKHLDNPSSKIMVDMRNRLEKQAINPIYSKSKFSFNTSDLDRFPKPAGAVAFFMGDRLGGSGWTVRLSDGTEKRYYVDLPKEMIESKLVFPPNEYEKYELIETAENYLNHIGAYLSDVVEFVRERKK